MVLPTGCPRSVGFLGFAGQKVEVPIIPWGWGPWLQMTGALMYIIALIPVPQAINEHVLTRKKVMY